MSVQQTAGVAALGTILRAMAARDVWTVAQLCTAHDLPRSSAFEIINKLHRAGFIRRGLKGQLHLGHKAIQLGYAGYGLAALAGPAEATLAWLREQTGAQIGLTATGPSPAAIIALPDNAWPFEPDISFALFDDRQQEQITLHMRHRAGASREERQWASHCAERSALTLDQYLKSKGFDA